MSLDDRTRPIEVTAGRPSLRQGAENARDSAALIKKRYNENIFERPEGIRTVALP